MTRQTKVTIAIPTYNRSRLLKEAIESALAQDYPDFRVVVVDNASSDDTEAVVRSFAEARVTYIRNEINIGCTRNFNRALELNSSPYLSLLMDDDVMLPGFIRESVMMLDEHTEVAFSFTAARYVDVDRVALGVQHTKDMPGGVMDGLEYIELHISGRECWIEPSTVMMRAAAVANVGPFDSPHSKYSQDLNLWYRLAARFPIAFIPRELVEVRVHQGQISELAFRQEGQGHYGTLAEKIDGISYLLESDRAADRSYRAWLAKRLRSLHFNQSMPLHGLIPDLYYSLTERLAMAMEEIARLIPVSDSFILVDQNQWGSQFVTDRRVVPFLERDGQYWGLPPDDQTAIGELERLRESGANFIVFGWPAFWWLDYYSGLGNYLSSRFRCVLKNSRLVAFDLRP